MALDRGESDGEVSRTWGGGRLVFIEKCGSGEKFYLGNVDDYTTVF